jgi:hypothetical protein
MSALQVNPMIVAAAHLIYLHPCSIDIEGKIAITDLKRCCLIINEVGSDDVKLRDDRMPIHVRVLNHDGIVAITYRSCHVLR